MPLPFSKVPQPNLLQTADELLLDVTTGSEWRLKCGHVTSDGVQRYKGALATVLEARDYPGWFLCKITMTDGSTCTVQLPIGWTWFRRTIRLRSPGQGDPPLPKAREISWRAAARMTVAERRLWEEI